MKIIHTADWHIGKTVNEFSMLEDQAFVLEQLVRFAAEERADALLISGDLYDRSVPPADAVSLVNRTLVALSQEYHIPVFLVAGNHDGPKRLSFLSDLLDQSGVHIAGQFQFPVKQIALQDEFGPVHFHLLPYTADHEYRAAFPEEDFINETQALEHVLRNIQKTADPSERHILLGHGFFSVSKNIENDYEDLESVGGSDHIRSPLFAKFDYCALGHLHGPHPAGADHVRYSGSLLKYSVDEAMQKKSVTVVTLGEKGNISIRTHALPVLRDLRTVQGRFETLLYQRAEKNENLDDYIFVVLEDETPIPDAVSRLRAVFPNIMGIRYQQSPTVSAQRQAARRRKQMTPEEIYRDFYQEVTGEALTAQQEAIITGLMQKVALERNEDAL